MRDSVRSDEHLVALRDGQVLKLLHQLGEKGIGDFRDDKAEHATAAGNQGAGLSVGQVADLVDGLPDAASEFGVHGSDVVDGAGDGGDGDAGALGDVADADIGGTPGRRVVSGGTHGRGNSTLSRCFPVPFL
jgi:hypothetical protein